MFPTSGTGQEEFAIIKQHVEATPDSIENNLLKLSQYLIQPAKNDLEKVKSLYQWLIHNINYDQKAYKNGNRRINRSNTNILKRRKAICWGYASLFKGMCEIVEIPCEIISGYGRTSWEKIPNLKSPNHAWNGVKIDGQWFLLDATWDSGAIGNRNIFREKFGHNYFLTPPQFFIANHLPADPSWQLLDCPISIKDYQLTPEEAVVRAKEKDCDSLKEVLIINEHLPVQDKRFLAARKAYAFNPTEQNRRDLAHAHIDYEAHLTEIAEQLQIEQKYDSLLLIQSEMIRLCEIATQLTTLFDTQLENCAYNYFNYAVALTQVVKNRQGRNLKKWEEVLQNLEEASNHLKALPQNLFTKNALAQCADYIDYAKSTISTLK